MLEKLYDFLSRYFTLLVVTFLVGIFVVLPMMSNAMIEVNGVDTTPDSEFFYSAADLNTIASEYTTEGKEVYMFTRFNLDLIWPVIYTTFFMSTIGLLKKGTNRRYIAVFYLLPIVAFLFDILENLLCSIYFNVSESLVVANVASLSSAVKWISLFVVLLYIIKLSFDKVIDYIK